jgi:hypothetical protein
MTLYYVECEYDIGLNIDGYTGVYATEEERDVVVEAGVSSCGIVTEELINECLLTYRTIEVKG